VERQEGINFKEIRKDHLNRYYLAAEIIKHLKIKNVTDIASGVGYGSKILSSVSSEVTSIERNKEAIIKAKKNFNSEKIKYINKDVFDYEFEKTDFVVCFEFLEHTEFHNKLFNIFKCITDKLIISTPNELERPYLMQPVNPFHIKHWEPEELEIKLKEYNFAIKKWFCQKIGNPNIYNGSSGKFMIAYCEKFD